MHTQKKKGLIILGAALVGVLTLAGGIYFSQSQALSTPMWFDPEPTFAHVQTALDQGTLPLVSIEEKWCDAYTKRNRGLKLDLESCSKRKDRGYDGMESLGQTQFRVLLQRRIKACKINEACSRTTYKIAQRLGNKGALIKNASLPAELQDIFDAHFASTQTTCTSNCNVMLLKLSDALNVKDPAPTQLQEALVVELMARLALKDEMLSSPQPLAGVIRELDAFTKSVRATLQTLPKTLRPPIAADPALAGTLLGASVARTALGQVPWMHGSWSYVKVSTGLRNVSFNAQHGGMLRVLLDKKGRPIAGLKTKGEEVLGVVNLLPSGSSVLPDEAKGAFFTRASASSAEMTSRGTLLATKDIQPQTQAMLATWAANHVATREMVLARINAHLSPAHITTMDRSLHRSMMLISFDLLYYSNVLGHKTPQGVTLTRPKKTTYRSGSSRRSSGVGYVPSSRRSVRSYTPTTRRSSYRSGGYRSGKN